MLLSISFNFQMTFELLWAEKHVTFVSRPQSWVYRGIILSYWFIKNMMYRMVKVEKFGSRRAFPLHDARWLNWHLA